MVKKDELQTVGKAEKRVDAVKLATGRATFVDDIALPGMLHARILHSPHAHARIRKIDAKKARAMPGVVAVLTHEDVPRTPSWPAAPATPSRSTTSCCPPCSTPSRPCRRARRSSTTRRTAAGSRTR